jgi:hypothetical protein
VQRESKWSERWIVLKRDPVSWSSGKEMIKVEEAEGEGEKVVKERLLCGKGRLHLTAGEWGIWKTSKREGDPVKRGSPIQVLEADMDAGLAC